MKFKKYIGLIQIILAAIVFILSFYLKQDLAPFSGALLSDWHIFTSIRDSFGFTKIISILVSMAIFLQGLINIKNKA